MAGKPRNDGRESSPGATPKRAGCSRREALRACAAWIACAATTGTAGRAQDQPPRDPAPRPLGPLVPIGPRGAPEPATQRLPAPAEDDASAEALRQYQSRLLARWQGDYRRVPLAVKADFFEAVLWRYLRTPWKQAHTHAVLPDDPAGAIRWLPSADTSTWNGALLAALAWKYAVTRDADTLAWIERLLEGLSFYQEVTGYAGFAARCVLPADGPVLDLMSPYTSPDGAAWRYWGDPAKGTYNQLVHGYATLLIHAEAELSPAARLRARTDLAALVLHVIDHDYHLTDGQGRRTPYGDITPLLGSVGVPFNAQVAYLIVAAGQCFPPDDAAQRERIAVQFRRLRGEHHAYYDKPLTNLISPQRIAASPLVKGMNDRQHAICAAHTGLALELFDAPRRSESFNEKFVYRLGRTLFHGAQAMGSYRNSLCNFMCAGLLADPPVFDCIVPQWKSQTRRLLDELLVTGVEQLRRFPLDRFLTTGRELDTPDVQWVDRFRPEDFYWKCDPTRVWETTGPPTNELFAAIDYLAAYWLLRRYGLDRHPAAQTAHGEVLA